MNKKVVKSVVVCLSAAIAVVAGVSFIRWQLSFCDVSFELSSEVSSIVIHKIEDDYTESSEEVARISENKTLRIKAGSYEIIPDGNNIDTSPIMFTADKTVGVIKIDPFYSGDYLGELLNKEQQFIHQVLLDYSKLISEYEISSETLYAHGEWYGAILSLRDYDPREGVDFYRVIMHKEGGTWKVAAEPSIVFSYSEYPDIPKHVINDVNRKAM